MGLTSDVNFNFKNLCEINRKIILLEQELLRNNDAFLKYILDDTYREFKIYYELSTDTLLEHQNEDLDHGLILSNFCIRIANDSIAVSGDIRKARYEKKDFILKKINEYASDPTLVRKYKNDLIEYELQLTQQQNSVGLNRDDFVELDMKKLSGAIGNPKNVMLSALGEEKH